MSEILLELFSEEIPSRMQSRASDDLARLVTKGLEGAGLAFEKVATYSTPRRLTLHITGVPPKSSDVREERKGPRVDAPDKALEGFLRSTGLTIEECEIHDDKKGQFYVAVIDREGRPTPMILQEIITDVVRNFPWPKSMRWGASRLKWVRPLHSILCLYDNKPVKFRLDGIEADNISYGHRFMAPKKFKAKSVEDYFEDLKERYVIIDADERADMILEAARKLAKAKKLKLVEDEALLQETAGLVEWPVVLMGSFDKSFLDVPGEVLTAAMKSHQKCFSLLKGEVLTNKFILVSNLNASDDGKAIIAGNERVIRARLSDAKFFWDNDKARPLESLLPKLDDIIFHAKLGTVGERVKRLVMLSGEIAPLVGADRAEAVEAAQFAKADLVTETVYEAPEMQGIAGRYLALNEGRAEAVAGAIEDHYKPQGPSDAVPSSPVSIAVALAEKLEILTGFWSIDEKPTGSKDPFALRRAALGVIRIILENDLRIDLPALFEKARPGFEQSSDLMSFFADRLKVYLRDKGARHDLIDAVYALEGQTDLSMIVRRVEALGEFLATDDGATLLAGFKRAQNILKIEEGKDKTRYDGALNPKLFASAFETNLAKAIDTVGEKARASIETEDFTGAMAAMAGLRQPVDGFFENVIVNDEDPKIRENRLNLLAAVRGLSLKVADFTRVEG